MYIYVFMLCICICTFVRMYVCYGWMDASMDGCIYVCMNMCVYICNDFYIVCLCSHVFIYVYMYAVCMYDLSVYVSMLVCMNLWYLCVLDIVQSTSPHAATNFTRAVRAAVFWALLSGYIYHHRSLLSPSECQKNKGIREGGF